METEKEQSNIGLKLTVCFHDRDKIKNPKTLENPTEDYLKQLNEAGYGIFETANSFFATTEQLYELAIEKNKKNVTKRNKEFLTKLNEVFTDADICKDSDGLSEEERDKLKNSLKEAINNYCPASTYIITKNGLQPRWWLNEPNIDEATQQKYVNITNGIIEWSKQNGSKGDPVKDVTRVLRKTGYYHNKSEPYLVTEEKGNGKTYTLDELKEYFWHDPANVVLNTKEKEYELTNNKIDSIDIRQVVIDVWKEKGNEASFDKDDHLIIDGELTATFKGRLGHNYIATTSCDYPAKGNAVTYVAETLNITTKEAYSWLCKKYSINDFKDSKKDAVAFMPAISHADLITKKFPPARYTIEPFFEQGTMNMLSAPPNTWKSWLLFLFAGNIVSGSSVFDKFTVERTNVMIVNEEDSPRLIQDRLKHLNIVDTSLSIYYRIAQGAKLKKDFVDDLIKEAKEKSIGVIMFDSLRSIHEADENDSTAMQGVMDLLKKIARENITVIFTHHHRKKSMFAKNDDSESSRGSSAINAAISGHLSLEEVNDKEGEKYLVLKHLKSKVGEKLQPFDIGIQTGDIVSFQYLGEHKPKEQALTEATTKILNELQRSDNLMSRKDFVYLGIGGMTTIKDALKSLEKDGKIKVILRKEAERSGKKTLGIGKANEKLYSLTKEDDNDVDLNMFDGIQQEDTWSSQSLVT
jgi:hypothetical protein